MSVHGKCTGDEIKSSRTSRRLRGSRYLKENESNNNANNNFDSDLYTKNHQANHTVETSKVQTPDCRSPALRRKSALIQSMSANFERKTIDSSQSSSNNQRIQTNGDVKSSSAASSLPTVEQRARPSLDVSDDEDVPLKKTGASARRGKLQREKRMLRQKRRSTGVVNIKDIEGDVNEKTVEDVQLKTETESNTVKNELSPTNPTSPTQITRVPSILKTSASSPTTPRQSNKSSKRASAAHDAVIVDMPAKTQPSAEWPAANDEDTEKLRKKLSLAELTISRLHEEIKTMDDELRTLEDENRHLKRSNKLLDDENTTMLRLIRAREFTSSTAH